jgi:hypothetical protein
MCASGGQRADAIAISRAGSRSGSGGTARHRKSART